jgi:outer membrane protein TolC
MSLPTPTPLDLPAALQYALEHSPVFQSARLEVEIQERNRKNALARFFPSLDVTATQGIQNQATNGTNPGVYGRVNLGLTETLYDNGINFLNFRSASLTEERSQIDLERDRARLSLALAREYYNYSLNSRLANIQRQQVDVLSKQVRSVEGQYRQGVRTRRDYLRFKTQLQRAEIDLVTAQNEQQGSSAEISRIIGAPASDIAQGSPTFTIQPLSESRARQALPTEIPAIEKHYEARLKAVVERINEIQVKVALRNYLPRANVTGNVGWGTGSLVPGTTEGPYQGAQSLDWNVQLQLTYNLWDWGILRREWQRAERLRDQGNNTLLANLQAAAADIRKLMLRLKQLDKNLELSRELLGYEEENYASLDADYKQGRVAFLDLITALENLFSARRNFARAFYAVQSALAEYHYHQGDLYESISKK